LSTPGHPSIIARRVVLVLGATLLVGLAWWRIRAARSEPAVSRAAEPAPPPRSEPVALPIVAASHTLPLPTRELAADGVPIMGARGDDSRNGPRHPHPITPEHQRIFRENSLIADLNGAMDVGDFRALRELNADYRKDYPEDDHLLQHGYDLIADCLEARTPENRAKAQRFFDTELASTLRRYVRRHCLE
jgi:hypothetical protein